MGVETEDSNVFVHKVKIAERYQNALVGSFESIPRSAIRDIHVNQELAGRVTDPNLLKWFDEDYLIRRAAIFGFANPKGSLHRIKTPSSKRSVYLQKDAFFTDEYGNGYGAVSAKGTGISNFVERHGFEKDPEGFFGNTHAFSERKVSTALAANGARVGRVIGHITLAPQELKKWMSQHKFSDDYNPIEELEKVLSNNDDPAILIRLEGADRLVDFRQSYKNYYSRQNAFARTARLHLREIESRGGPDAYFEHYGLNELPYLVEALKLLESAGREEQPVEKIGPFNPYSQINFLYYYFTELNYLAAKNASKRDFGGGLTVKNYEQDVDLAGFWYDFETSLPNVPQYYEDGNPETLEKYHPLPPEARSNKKHRAKQIRARGLARKHLRTVDEKSGLESISS